MKHIGLHHPATFENSFRFSSFAIRSTKQYIIFTDWSTEDKWKTNLLQKCISWRFFYYRQEFLPILRIEKSFSAMILRKNIILQNNDRRGKCSNLAHFLAASLKNKKNSTLKKILIFFSKKSHPKQISYTLKYFFTLWTDLGKIK